MTEANDLLIVWFMNGGFLVAKRSEALQCPNKEAMVWDPSIMLNVRESEGKSSLPDYMWNCAHMA